MSRMIRRVPLDFDWPLDEPWKGFFIPDNLRADPCPDCESGYSPRAQHLHNLWYGYAPFHPSDNGSPPLTAYTPGVRAFAERQISQSPEFYGRGEAAIVREGERLAALWNRQWAHHLTGDDVDALIEAERLHDFTHDWNPEIRRWVKKDPPVIPTAAQVNAWSLNGMGHDSINASVVVLARCKREGVSERCATCGGRASLEAYPGQRADVDAWEPTPPPTGEGWQMWETISEGSPQTPVFATAAELAAYLVKWKGYRETAAWRLIADGTTGGSFATRDGRMYDMAMDADILAGDVAPGTTVTVERVEPTAIDG